jgi:hypothetical protein
MLRGQKVLLDRDLAELYGIETKTLKQAVKRNIERFPEDFAFVLDREEVAILRSQFVTSSSDGWGGTRYMKHWMHCWLRRRRKATRSVFMSAKKRASTR